MLTTDMAGVCSLGDLDVRLLHAPDRSNETGGVNMTCNLEPVLAL